MGERLPIEELRREHQALRRDIGAIRDLARSVGRSGGGAREDALTTLRDNIEMFLRGLRLHSRREEEGLFPDVQRMVSERPQRADPLGQFFAGEAEEDLNAHEVLNTRAQDMLNLVHELGQAEALQPQSLGRLRTLAELSRDLLERHADKEDRMIFPMIERSLDADQIEQVRKRLAALGSAADLLSSDGEAEDLRGLGAEER